MHRAALNSPLKDQLEEIFRTVFVDDAITLSRETSAADIPNWDSFEHINLMFTIEQTFGIQFSSRELGSFKNVGELLDALEQKGAA